MADGVFFLVFGCWGWPDLVAADQILRLLLTRLRSNCLSFSVISFCWLASAFDSSATGWADGVGDTKKMRATPSSGVGYFSLRPRRRGVQLIKKPSRGQWLISLLIFSNFLFVCGALIGWGFVTMR